MSAAAVLHELKAHGITLDLSDGQVFVEGPDDVLTDELLGAIRELEPEIAALLEGNALVAIPFTAAERDAIPSGSLYAEPGPDASHAREASQPGQQPAPTVRVSFVERPPRHKLAKMRDDERHCEACKARGPLEGALPFAWGVHSLPGVAELALTCSKKCRVELGLRSHRDR